MKLNLTQLSQCFSNQKRYANGEMEYAVSSIQSQGVMRKRFAVITDDRLFELCQYDFVAVRHNDYDNTSYVEFFDGNIEEYNNFHNSRRY